jgi:hypothetical protein
MSVAEKETVQIIVVISQYVSSHIELYIFPIVLGYKRYIWISVKYIYRPRSLNRGQRFLSEC